MSLTDDELQRIRREVVENVLDLGAEPYVAHKRIFDVIKSNCSASSVAATSSSTAVTAAGPTVLTLAAVAGLAVGTKVQLDVDSARETCSVRFITGQTISVVCTKTHGGTYPVEVESALTMVRGALSDLAAIQQEINAARKQAGVKQVDEVQFFGDGSFASTRTAHLRQEQQNLRIDLARMLGLGGLLRRNVGGGMGFEVY